MTDTYGRGKPVPAYDEADEAAAREAIDLAGSSPSPGLIREIAGAVAGARRDAREATLRAILTLPGARATVRPGPEAFSNTKIECVEVPLDSLEESSPEG